MRYALFGLTLLALAGCSTENPLLPVPSYRDTSVPLTTSADFDPARYAGRWYEIASYPVPFQSGCTNTQAVYTPQADGSFAVRNRCRRNDEIAYIEGEAEVSGPARLRVRLDGTPFVAPYWVLWVDETYQTAVVGVPSGRAGWILSRTPEISPAQLAEAQRVLASNGYDLSRLRRTPQE